MVEASSVIRRKYCCGEEYRMTGVLPDCRKKIIEITRSWLGTPYKHQSSIKGEGCDCIGMVRGVYREFYGLDKDPESIPPYQPDWYEVDQRDPLLAFGRKYMEEVPFEEMIPSDVLVFRMKEGASAKHCGIISAPDTMIHAYSRERVFEVSLGQHWYRRVAAVLRFPCPEEGLPWQH